MNKPFDPQHALKHGCTTRDGRKARIICNDAKLPGGESIIALIADAAGDEIWTSYFAAGTAYKNRESCLDLLNIPIQHKRKIWVNLYPTRNGGAFDNKGQCDLGAGSDRIACKEIEITFTEGEGL